ncbi:hypothetical protein MTR_1g086430 [Medicago truncatula]|uniref:NPR1/NH1-interacting protein n=1 Tax=Medicago truncatula TaxID=3880 RepID=G7ICS8_MEDTR|nr:hypothetical protein MTR_1g086430 [Medicago truncatula]
MEINGSKKRKICNEELDEEKQKEEEEKIETFFALVRNMRETRDRWRNKMSENIKEENRVVGVWKPTFKLEDFAEEGASKSNNINCANIIKEDDTEKVVYALSSKNTPSKFIVNEARVVTPSHIEVI